MVTRALIPWNCLSYEAPTHLQTVPTCPVERRGTSDIRAFTQALVTDGASDSCVLIPSQQHPPHTPPLSDQKPCVIRGPTSCQLGGKSGIYDHLSCWEWGVLMEKGILAEQGKAPGGQSASSLRRACRHGSSYDLTRNQVPTLYS